MRFCMGGVSSPDAGKFISFAVVALIAIVAFVVVGTSPTFPTFPVDILWNPISWFFGGILLLFLSSFFYLVYCAVCHLWFPKREPGYPFKSTQYGNPRIRYEKDEIDRTQYFDEDDEEDDEEYDEDETPPKATIGDSKQKLVRSRLRKFDLPVEEAELVFGTEWKDVLGKKHIEYSGGFFLEILIIQNQILLNLSYRKKIFHIIDKLARMIDSVFNENHTIKYLDERWGDGYYQNYKNQWEFFKIYKKTRPETKSENNLTEAKAYKVLGLGSTATDEQLNEKYREQCLIHHPDRGGNDEQFKKIKQAYEFIRQIRQDSLSVGF